MFNPFARKSAKPNTCVPIGLNGKASNVLLINMLALLVGLYTIGSAFGIVGSFLATTGYFVILHSISKLVKARFVVMMFLAYLMIFIISAIYYSPLIVVAVQPFFSDWLATLNVAFPVNSLTVMSMFITFITYEIWIEYLVIGIIVNRLKIRNRLWGVR